MKGENRHSKQGGGRLHVQRPCGRRKRSASEGQKGAGATAPQSASGEFYKMKLVMQILARLCRACINDSCFYPNHNRNY